MPPHTNLHDSDRSARRRDGSLVCIPHQMLSCTPYPTPRAPCSGPRIPCSSTLTPYHILHLRHFPVPCYSRYYSHALIPSPCSQTMLSQYEATARSRLNHDHGRDVAAAKSAHTTYTNALLNLFHLLTGYDHQDLSTLAHTQPQPLNRDRKGRPKQQGKQHIGSTTLHNVQHRGKVVGTAHPQPHPQCKYSKRRNKANPAHLAHLCTTMTKQYVSSQPILFPPFTALPTHIKHTQCSGHNTTRVFQQPHIAHHNHNPKTKK
jgi:hypothetical protein